MPAAGRGKLHRQTCEFFAAQPGHGANKPRLGAAQAAGTGVTRLMTTPLNILFVEDNSHDVELVLGELQRAGFDPRWKRVETEPDFLAELNHAPDIILSDYSMPQFTGLRAAEVLQASGLNIPFILISGTVGEDVAVEAMKHGAMDYL